MNITQMVQITTINLLIKQNKQILLVLEYGTYVYTQNGLQTEIPTAFILEQYLVSLSMRFKVYFFLFILFSIISCSLLHGSAADSGM